MATAIELLANPELDLPLITAHTSSDKGYSHDELAHFRIGHDDIFKLVVTLFNFGTKKKPNVKRDIRQNVTDAFFEDAIDKTPTFSITIFDPEWELLNLGLLDGTMDINPGKLPDRWYRLNSVSVVDNDVTLIFETRNAVYLSGHKRPVKANRNRMTRAEFIKNKLLFSVKKTRIPFYCPQLETKQKIRKTTFPSETARKNGRKKGFSDSDKITVKGARANQKQRDTIEHIIDAGIDVKAPALVIVLAVMTTIQESNAGTNVSGNPPFVGPFQQASKYGWPGTGDAYKDAKGFYAKAIPYYKAHHGTMTLGMMAQKIQGADPNLNPANSGFAQETDGHRAESEHAVNAYGGIDTAPPGEPDQIEFKKKYEFIVGEPDGPNNENYLAATYRLAEEVHWRAYWVKNTLHYISEEDLFKAKARTRLRRYYDGVESISFEWDRGKKIQEMRVRARMERWICPVGTVVIFDEGGPARGRWLVTNIHRSMFDELGEITLSQPMNERAEPANEPGSREPTVQENPNIVADGGNITGSCGIETITSDWSPRQIIEKCVIKHARNHGMTSGITAAGTQAANDAHKEYVSGTTRKSWHKGPGYLQYAVDMGHGSPVPTPQMDDLAAELIMAFNMTPLVSPHAVPPFQGGGNISEGWHKGFHFQLLYRTTDHWDHVHFGAKREPSVNP